METPRYTKAQIQKIESRLGIQTHGGQLFPSTWRQYQHGRLPRPSDFRLWTHPETGETRIYLSHPRFKGAKIYATADGDGFEVKGWTPDRNWVRRGGRRWAFDAFWMHLNDLKTYSQWLSEDGIPQFELMPPKFNTESGMCREDWQSQQSWDNLVEFARRSQQPAKQVA